MVSIEFTPRGREGEIREADGKSKRQYRKRLSRKARAGGCQWERETDAGEGREGGGREGARERRDIRRIMAEERERVQDRGDEDGSGGLGICKNTGNWGDRRREEDGGQKRKGECVKNAKVKAGKDSQETYAVPVRQSHRPETNE
jgi:hypothetical protein